MISYEIEKMHAFKCHMCQGKWSILSFKLKKIVCPHCGVEDKPISKNKAERYELMAALNKTRLFAGDQQF